MSSIMGEGSDAMPQSAARQVLENFHDAGLVQLDESGDFQARKVKSSHYTLLIPIKPDEFGARALAYNSFHKSFAVFDEADIDAFRKVEAQGEAEAEGLVENLASARFLHDAQFDEFAAVKRDYWAQRNNDEVLSLTITPTIGCNYACHYCFQGLNKPTSKMSDQVQDQILEVVKSRIGVIKSVSVTWFGGEPLMDRPGIYRLSQALIELCDENGINYSASIVTNGHFLDVETANKLLDLRCTEAQVTIDGTKAVHDVNRPMTSGRGTYDRIIENIKNVINDTTFKVIVRCNVNTGNASNFSAMLDEFDSLGFAGRQNLTVYFSPVEAITDDCASAEAVLLSKANYAETELMLLRKAIELGLAAPPEFTTFMGICVAVAKNGLVISPEGEVHRCWDQVHRTADKVGTIFDIEAIETNAINKRWHAFDPWDNPICSSCKIAPMCAGFCSHKFQSTDETHGEASALPCPPWKFNTAEYIFLNAEARGFVTMDDWDPEQKTSLKMHAGRIHTNDSMASANKRIVSKAQIAATIYEANESGGAVL